MLGGWTSRRRSTTGGEEVCERPVSGHDVQVAAAASSCECVREERDEGKK
jgi:hypothetical protein